MKTSYAVLILFSMIVILFTLFGSFKKNIEKFENIQELTKEEKDFIDELQNTETSEIMKLVKKKNLSKEHIEELISKLSVKEEKPVSVLEEKTYID
jgi:Glu-tRNA(Gln) amidotransferase subunit E-like FAD-binding protein